MTLREIYAILCDMKAYLNEKEERKQMEQARQSESHKRLMAYSPGRMIDLNGK